MDIGNDIILNTALNVLGVVLLLVLRIIGKKKRFAKTTSFLINVFLVYFVVRVLSVALAPFKLTTLNQYLYFAETLILAFAIIKAMMFAIIELFLRSRRGVEIPKIIQDTIFAVLYFVLLMITLKVVLNINLTSILTTSAVLTMVLGLSLQDNLSNLFSGLAIQIEKPFSIGEWVKFADTIGKVKELSWRSVKLLTLENDLFIIPNNKIIKETVVNYNRPTHLHIEKFKIGVSYKHPPNVVKETILEVLKNEKDISHEPKPHIRLVNYGDFSISYEIRYYISNFNRHLIIEDSITTKIWYAFKRNEIHIPFPIRDVNLRTISDEKEQKEKDEALKELEGLLKTIDVLSPLSKPEIKKLAVNGKTMSFCAGEDIMKEGDEGDSMFLILGGEVDVTISLEGDETKSVAKLYENDFFGERSLMTGEKRSATVTALKDSTFFMIDKENFKSVISSHQDALKQISDILSKRELELKATRQEGAKKVTNSQVQQNSKQLFQKIIKFLGF